MMDDYDRFVVNLLSETTYKHDGPACASKSGFLFWELKVGQFHPISAFGWVTVLKSLAQWQAYKGIQLVHVYNWASNSIYDTFMLCYYVCVYLCVSYISNCNDI